MSHRNVVWHSSLNDLTHYHIHATCNQTYVQLKFKYFQANRTNEKVEEWLPTPSFVSLLVFEKFHNVSLSCRSTTKKSRTIHLARLSIKLSTVPDDNSVGSRATGSFSFMKETRETACRSAYWPERTVSGHRNN